MNRIFFEEIEIDYNKELIFESGQQSHKPLQINDMQIFDQ